MITIGTSAPSRKSTTTSENTVWGKITTRAAGQGRHDLQARAWRAQGFGLPGGPGDPAARESAAEKIQHGQSRRAIAPDCAPTLPPRIPSISGSGRFVQGRLFGFDNRPDQRQGPQLEWRRLLMLTEQTSLHLFANHQEIKSKQSRQPDVLDTGLVGRKQGYDRYLRHRRETRGDQGQTRYRRRLHALRAHSSEISVNTGASNPAFPDLTTTLDSLKLYANYRLKDNVSLLGGYWYEHYDSRELDARRRHAQHDSERPDLRRTGAAVSRACDQGGVEIQVLVGGRPCRRRPILVFQRRTSMHQLVDLDDGQQDGEHDQQHDPAHHQDHHRLEQRQEHRQAPLERLGLEVRGALAASAPACRSPPRSPPDGPAAAETRAFRRAPAPGSRLRARARSRASMASRITMLVITRAPELSAESSGTPPPTRMASVLAKREVLTPRISDPSQGRRSNSACQRRLGASRRSAMRAADHGADDDRRRDTARPRAGNRSARSARA